MKIVSSRTGSAIFDNHPLHHVGDVFHPVGGFFEHLVDLFPANQIEKIFLVVDDVDQSFAQNSVGPIGLDLVPTGGNAMIVFNNELRAPLFSVIDGVVFADIGNVYRLISDISLDLRQSVGAGLRVRTRWFLLRGDYGVVLDPRPGERRGRFYFSIGQAF